MKAVNQIEQEMNNIQVSLSTEEHKKAVRSKMKKRYQFLATCKLYIKSNPDKEFLSKERERLNNRIKLIGQSYFPNERLINAGLKKEEQKEHKDYNKMMGLTKCKDQLKAISFLLS